MCHTSCSTGCQAFCSTPSSSCYVPMSYQPAVSVPVNCQSAVSVPVSCQPAVSVPVNCHYKPLVFVALSSQSSGGCQPTRPTLLCRPTPCSTPCC
ncbi:hypothetical protein PANDA_011490, partial [Ailuropoda melanoleuca]